MWCSAVHYYLRCGAVMLFCERFWCGFCGLMNTPSENYKKILIYKKKGVLDAHKKIQRDESCWMQMNFNRKRDVSRKVERFKARLMAKGYTQDEN